MNIAAPGVLPGRRPDTPWQRLIAAANALTPLRVGLIAFIYTLLVGLLVQLVVLPHLLPAWHAGHGLLANRDWVYFHQLASTVSERISEHGWGTWELRPEGQAVAGIMAIFYTLFTAEPWTVLPLYCLLYAISVTILFLFARSLLGNPAAAALATLPCLLLPSAATIYAQPHKDAFVLFGLLSVCWAAIRVSQTRHSLADTLIGLPLSWLGLLAVWMMRPYLLQVLEAAGLIVFVVAVINASLRLRTGIRHPSDFARQALLPILLSALVWLPCNQLKRIDNNVDPAGAQARLAEIKAEKARLAAAEAAKKQAALQVASVVAPAPKPAPEPPPATPPAPAPVAQTAPPIPTPAPPPVPVVPKVEIRDWQPSTWLPPKLDGVFYTLAKTRDGFRTTKGGSNIDAEVKFESAEDVLSYIPRAMQLALLSPFPSLWFSQGSHASGTLERRIGGLEMLLVYVALGGIIPAAKRWWRRREFCVPLLVALPLLLTYGLTIVNVGTLYRLRYPMELLIMTIGLAGYLGMYLARRQPPPATPAAAA
ncbi:hypothetical protein [Parachitinimonas caeni]|uniref:Glycosyltransferase RgtA/B/C/D-like domain-containing protein n=1 Tax=Parachitinimonas caeni TaxID=3031301 RepID=A0ABT7DS59_9NEIS|nr:hypothetical protein [Parachitinimonas caeni]MDK2122896.1 hypothetical protein [Parachitinimonas caeni]